MIYTWCSWRNNMCNHTWFRRRHYSMMLPKRLQKKPSIARHQGEVRLCATIRLWCDSGTVHIRGARYGLSARVINANISASPIWQFMMKSGNLGIWGRRTSCNKSRNSQHSKFSRNPFSVRTWPKISIVDLIRLGILNYGNFRFFTWRYIRNCQVARFTDFRHVRQVRGRKKYPYRVNGHTSQRGCSVSDKAYNSTPAGLVQRDPAPRARTTVGTKHIRWGILYYKFNTLTTR